MLGKDTVGAGDQSVLEALTDAVYIVDADGRIQFCNPALERLTGYAAGTLLGRPSLDLYALEDWPSVRDRRTWAFRGEPVSSRLEATLVRHDGARLPVELFVSSLTREGRVVGRVTVLRDISARTRAEAALQASEECFRLLVEGVQDYAIYLLDAEGRVATWNTGAERIKGYIAADIIGEPFSRFFPPEEQARGTPARLLEQTARDGHYVGEGWRVRKDGSRFWASVVMTALRDGAGSLRGFAKVTRDMTTRQEAEEALRQANAALEQRVEERTAALRASEARFRTLTSLAPVGIFLTDVRGDGLFVNECWCEMAGLTPEEAQGRGWVRALHPEDRECVAAEWYAAAQHGREFLGEYRYCTPAGHITWLQGRAVALTDAAGAVTGYLGTVTDITERKRAEAALRASEAQLRLVTDSAPVFLARCDTAGRYRFVNRGYAEHLGLSREQVIGRRIPEVVGEEAYASSQAYVERAFAGEPVEFEVEVPHQAIGQRWMHCAYVPERDAAGAVRGLIAVLTDVTARKRMEAQLEASLQEKEVLLKEIHHRVKNNLQVISSLLSLQHQAIDDPHVLALFEESARRIRAMALVHETLYQTGDLGRFNLAQYIPPLSRQLLQAYGVEAQRIAVHLDLAEVTLPLDMAVPCGLILNELLSNCLQHAFPGRQAGDLTVTLTHTADRVTLMLRDNGCGFPADLDFRHTESLGLQLVCALTEQLDGTMTLERSGGTAFTLTFPLPSGPGSGEASADSPYGGGLRG